MIGTVGAGDGPMLLGTRGGGRRILIGRYGPTAGSEGVETTLGIQDPPQGSQPRSTACAEKIKSTAGISVLGSIIALEGKDNGRTEPRVPNKGRFGVGNVGIIRLDRGGPT